MIENINTTTPLIAFAFGLIVFLEYHISIKGHVKNLKIAFYENSVFPVFYKIGYKESFVFKMKLYSRDLSYIFITNISTFCLILLLFINKFDNTALLIFTGVKVLIFITEYFLFEMIAHHYKKVHSYTKAIDQLAIEKNIKGKEQFYFFEAVFSPMLQASCIYYILTQLI